MTSFFVALILCSSLGWAEESPDVSKKDMEAAVASFSQAVQESNWDEAEKLFLGITDPSYDELLMGAQVSIALGEYQVSHDRYTKANAKKINTTPPKEFRILDERTVFTQVEGEGTLIFEGEGSSFLLRMVDTANQKLKSTQRSADRLPIGLYRFQDGGLLVSSSAVERLDTVTLEKMLLDKENQKNSFGGRVRTILEPWLSETTSIRARGGLHSHFFGSDSSDVAMQSSWSFGPTVGLIWQKKKEEWGLGLESNAYMSVSGRAFFFGLHGDAFGEYELPRGFISAGLRYDFSVGRVVGVQLREQMGTVTEEELNALAIPGVALSLGVWTGYRYPIYENIDAQVRVGFRNDGKRMYFDSDIGAVFSVPF